MDEWKHNFDDWCKGYFVDGKSTQAVLTQNEIDKILAYLKNPEDLCQILPDLSQSQRAKFKYKVKAKKYSWMTVPAIGNQECETVLTVPRQEGRVNVVVPMEKFFPTLYSLHENSGHARSKTMWEKIRVQYALLPKSALMRFLEGCISCQCRAQQRNEAEPQQIVASEVFSRLQVDLIDMTMKPSAGYKYILHLMDHFTKFHMLLPLKGKSALEVNTGLKQMFSTIGLPHILQTDNGSEFAQLGDIFRDTYGQGPEAYSLLRVPLSLDSIDGQIRYNHFVPAVQRSDEEVSALMSRCGAADIGACNIHHSDTQQYVQCDDCHRWYHSLCLGDSTRSHTMKRQMSLSCGCLRNGPFRPKRSSLLKDVKKVNKVLNDHRPAFKVLLADVANKKLPSWRDRSYKPIAKPNVNSNVTLKDQSGLTLPSGDVTIRLRQFIDQQLPAPSLTQSYIECVLFPELLIRLFMLEWNITKVEVEYIFRMLAGGRRDALDYLFDD